MAFQSAVRISVWLKGSTGYCRGRCQPLSIRRADLCLVEVAMITDALVDAIDFQSAVRISVWLKLQSHRGT